MGGSSLNKETQTFFSLDTPSSPSDMEVLILILSFHTWLQTAPVHAEGLGSKEPTKTTFKHPVL